MAPTRPNLFIVGMPRAGTTSLHHYLSQHPQVAMSEHKEPHFFGSDLHRPKGNLSEADYLSLFHPSANTQWMGESSVFYLSSFRAPEEIHAYSPEACIIISLRNPVEQVFSLHTVNLWGGNERIVSFEPALEAEQGRIQHCEERLTSTHAVEEALFYRRNILMLPESILSYQHVFGKDRVKIIFFDDLRKDTAAIYREICDFLGIDGSFMPDFSKRNESGSMQYSFLRPLMRQPLVEALLSRLRSSIFWWPMKRLYRLVLSVIASKKELRPETRKQLLKEFLPVIEQLEEITGRDLSKWKKA